MPQRIDSLVALFNQRRYAEVEQAAQEILLKESNHGFAWKALAAVSSLQGRTAESLPLMLKAAQLLPEDAEVHNNLGNTLKNLGRLDEAEASYRRALEIKPGFYQALSNLGSALLELGRPDQAMECNLRALEIEPEFAEGSSNLGNALLELGRFGEAKECYLKALQIKPQFALALNNLGNALLKLGRVDEAAASYLRALEIEPDYTEALSNQGLALKELGRVDEAKRSYLRALKIRPDYAPAHSNLGRALQEQGRLHEAEASYRQALESKPDFSQAHNNLGNILLHLGQLDEAEKSHRRALGIEPEYHEAHYNLGNVLSELGRLHEAEASYLRALEIKPEFAPALNSLGNTHRDRGNLDEALACYRQALSLNPNFPEARWAMAMAQVPPILSTNHDLPALRKNFSRELDELDRWFDDQRINGGVKGVGCHHPFYLAYQELSNKALMSRYGALCNRVMNHWQRLQGYKAGGTASEGAIRIGIVSRHIYEHSVWHAIIKGWLLFFDKSKFELHVFYLNRHHDSETALAQSLATSFIEKQGSLPLQVEAILAQGIEILIYPEIGMDPMTVQLANLRLAPVQVATWGHPDTTGLPTIDYYLSAQDLEGENPAENYSEKLIELPNLGCCYSKHPVTAIAPDRGGLGIDPELPLLICAGTPFKYTPQNDWVLVEIARQLGECQMIFFTFKGLQDLSSKLKRRLECAFEQGGLNFNKYGLFVPYLNGQLFSGLMQLADVYLDTIGFSGFNSAMRAVECGLPIVTQEGRFLRGRLASGILKRINLSELVSASKEEYISMAVKLSTDKRYRQSIKERMEQSRHLLFNDLEPIHALEDFITVVCRPSSRCAETPTWKRTTNFPWSSEQLVIRRNVPPGQ